MNNSGPSISYKKFLDTNSDEFYFQWHITDKCNLRVIHGNQDGKDPRSDLSLTQLKIIADRITLSLEKWHKRGRIAKQAESPF